jgi:diketogulonate reductase-like aldo/keto reductase
MNITSIADRVTLNNGITMPRLGIGTWQGRPEDGAHVERAVETALSLGYRSIDTAAGYANEAGVGRSVRASGLLRDEVFVTSKVKNSDQGYDSALRAFDASLKALNLDYVDLYLVHWPVKGKYKDTWRALEKVYAEGRVKAIGVSNFQVHHLKDLLAGASVAPTVNQIELHPRLTQKELLAFCARQEIQVEAWSPLMLGRILTDRVIVDIAKFHGKSPAQVILRWDLQQGLVTIPKSTSPHRIAENAGLFDFELRQADMEALERLNRNERSGPDPDNFNF